MRERRTTLVHDPGPLPTVEGGFGCIVADPPWLFDDQGSRATPDYPFMTTEDIRALPVQGIRAPKSHLYLWVPDTHLRDALAVVEDWGFEYKHLIPWVKRRIIRGSGRRPIEVGPYQIGMGHYFRKAHEVCMFCVSGKLKLTRRDMPSVLEGPKTKGPSGQKHSVKPKLLLKRAEVVSPGPYLEMFARSGRKGWISWGDEIPRAA